MRTVLWVVVAMFLVTPAFAAPKTLEVNAFSFELTLTLPGTPEEIFDAATGDITGWWDHSFHKPPMALILEPKVGGSFIEKFDEQGNGARHAVVILCERPRTIRFEGPLGLSGDAIQMVHTYAFEAADAGSTRMTLTVKASGAVDAAVAGVVESVWKHFLIEQFKPFVESGKHKQKK